MFCKNCNLTFDNNLKFCTSCGEPLVDMELLALIPENEREDRDIPNMLFWKLHSFCSDLNNQAMSSIEGLMSDQTDMLDSFFAGDMQAYEKKRARIESDENVQAENENFRNRALNVISFIKNNLWMFEAANYVLLKAGKTGVDMAKFKIGNINLKELEDIDDNFEKLSSISDYNFELNDFMTDLALYTIDVADKINEIIE